MIRFGATAEGGAHIIGLGISDANIEELRKGRPIFVAGSTVGAPGVEVLIFWGRTEYEITESLAKVIGPQTEVRCVEPHELPPDHRDYRARGQRDQV